MPPPYLLAVVNVVPTPPAGVQVRGCGLAVEFGVCPAWTAPGRCVGLGQHGERPRHLPFEVRPDTDGHSFTTSPLAARQGARVAAFPAGPVAALACDCRYRRRGGGHSGLGGHA